MQSILAAATASACALIAAAPGEAATVTSGGTYLSFEAADGELNHVSVEITPMTPMPVWEVRDGGAPLTAGAGCVSVDAHTVECNRWVIKPCCAVGISLGDNDDWVSIANAHGACAEPDEIAFHCSTWIDGGDGDDTLIGSDTIYSNGVLRGGTGDDTVHAGAGGATLVGGPGADTLVGGSARDSASYADRLEPVFVSLDGLRNDGEAGENDLVVEVEDVVGTPRDDVLIGDSGDNLLKAGAGNDVARGGDGSDTIYGDSTRCAVDAAGGGGNDRISGEDGRDSLFGCGGDDVLGGGGGRDDLVGAAGADLGRGGPGADSLRGGWGFDSLSGGRGNDLIRGQGGNDALGGGLGRDDLQGGPRRDTFYARDGFADRVRGGPGYDRARIDRGLDVLSSIAALF